MADDGWAWEDGWVLASIVIARASEHPDLAGVIGVADYINRGILNRDEIERAANRLIGARLLDASDQLLRLELATSLWERANGDGGMVARVQRLVTLLNREAEPREPDHHWSLADVQYHTAARLYDDRFDQAMHRLDEQDSGLE